MQSAAQIDGGGVASSKPPKPSEVIDRLRKQLRAAGNFTEEDAAQIGEAIDRLNEKFRAAGICSEEDAVQFVRAVRMENRMRGELAEKRREKAAV